MESHGGEHKPHVPGPSVWPIGFALGIACLLVGLIVSPVVTAVGAAITVVFAFLWVRDLTVGKTELLHAPPDEARAEAGVATALPAPAGGPAMPPAEAGDRFPRSRFLEGATLGIGAIIGGVVTVPAAGLAVAPAFTGPKRRDVDLGPLADYPEGQYTIVTFLEEPDEGEVSRRTAYIRNNGFASGVPSFTIISNRCAHLGCPVQPNGPIQSDAAKTLNLGKAGVVSITPVQPAGFGCPCHGGQYDTEGNVTAGPPVRALDRFEFSIRNGHVFLGKAYSVGKVHGEGATAKIEKYELHGPGQHVDDWEWWFYPGQPPH